MIEALVLNELTLIVIQAQVERNLIFEFKILNRW
tara:strand:- start:426 stop:527 length:102 start_codon:yes stop_codon:yes gene_type:complete